MYYHQSLLSQDDFDDDDDGVLYRHVDPRSSLTLPAAVTQRQAAAARHTVSRSSYGQRRSRLASSAHSGSRWDGRRESGSGVSALAPSQPPPTSLFALPSRIVPQSLDDQEGEEEPEREYNEQRQQWDDDDDIDTDTGARQHRHGGTTASPTALPSRSSLFSPHDEAGRLTVASPQPQGEDDSKWNAADEATARVLQRAKVRQEQSDEDFFWSDPVVVKEEGGQRALGGNGQTAMLTGALLTERQKKERVYAQKLQNQQQRVKRANHSLRESNLATLSASRQRRAAAPLPSSQQRTPAALSSHHGHFSAQLEADLSVKRLINNKSLEIEDADAPSPISEEALAAGRAMAAEREQQNWRDQLDAQLDASTSSVSTHSQPLSHSRRSKKRGGLEEQLERVLRMRHSLHARYTSEQERLRRSSQQVDDGLTADAQGCVRAVVVKLVASIEHYSLLFAVGVMCSPYRVAESDGFAPAAIVQQLDTALPSLRRVARTLRVDVGRLALVVFNSQQRQAMHVPDKLSTPIYVRLTWPWFDVGSRMGVFGHVLLDMFDCCVIDDQQGAQYERQAAERWETEREQREADTRRQLDLAEQELGDRPNVVVDDAELRKQQDAMREIFGDLTEAEVESLFDDDNEDVQQQQPATNTSAAAALPLPARRPFSSYRRLPLSSVTPYTSLWFTCLVGIVRKVSLHGHSIQPSDPNSRIIQHQLLPSLLLDDGTGMVQVEVSLRCVERWRDVLLRGEGNVIWIGAARINETPSSGHGVRDGLRQLMAGVRL